MTAIRRPAGEAEKSEARAFDESGRDDSSDRNGRHIDHRLGCRSADVILESFRQSSTLITISRRPIIIASNPEEAANQFSALMGQLWEIENRVPNPNRGKSLLSWVLDAGRQKKDDLAVASFKRLQSVFDALTKETRSWLADRTTVFAANADLDWIKNSLLGTTCSEAAYGCSDHNAPQFFATFDVESTTRFEAFTAFRKAERDRDERPIDFGFYGHAAPDEADWHQGARAEEWISKQEHLRDEFMQLIYDASFRNVSSQYPISESESASKLFSAGFMMFEFEKFIELE